jgi:Kdo2-lipid IVA lauroyltransferase/acyltransferase
MRSLPATGTGERQPRRVDHDRPTAASWTFGQRLKNDLLFAFARAALAMVHLLPRGWLPRLGRAVGRVGYVVFRSARRTAYENVANVLPHLDRGARRRLVRACYLRLGEHLGDALALLGGAPLVPIPLADDSRDLIEGARAEGNGVVFVSAHLGPWERVAGSLVAAGLPLTTVAREAYDRRFNELYDALRAPLGVRVAYRGAATAPFRMLRALKDGGLLGMPMDLRSSVPSVDVEFLGRPAPTAIGPARIALRTGSAVVVGTVAPGPRGRYLITATRIATTDLASDAEIELTDRINRELSHRILALPHEWVWMHSRWTRG